MVRERKKSSAKPAGDFKRRKAKVGKRAVAPMTSTSTKFSSKRIAMPEQSVLKERDDDAPTAAQGRELKLLLAQINHYSPSVRTEAAKGLTQLVSKYKRLVHSNLRSLILAASERFGDSEDVPRAAGQEFLQQLVLAIQEVAERKIGPFEMLLIAHLGSALTSLERSVRFDGLVSVSIILGQDPGIQCTLGQSWLTTLLPCLVDVLKGTGTGLRIAAGGGRVLVKTPKSKSGAKIGARLKCLRALVSLLTASKPSKEEDKENRSGSKQPKGLYRSCGPVVNDSAINSGSFLRSGLSNSEEVDAAISDTLWADLVQGLKNAWTEACMSSSTSNDTRLELLPMQECIMIAESVSLLICHWGQEKVVSVLNSPSSPLGRSFNNLVGVLASSRMFPFVNCPNQSKDTAALLDQTIVDTIIQCAMVTSVTISEHHMVEEEEEEEEEEEDEDEDISLTIVTAVRAVVDYLKAKLGDTFAAVNNVALLKNLSNLLLAATVSSSPKLYLHQGCGKLTKKLVQTDKVHTVSLSLLRKSFDCLATSVSSDTVGLTAGQKKTRYVGLANLASTVSSLLCAELDSEGGTLSTCSLAWCSHLPTFLISLTKLVRGIQAKGEGERSSVYFEPIISVLTCLIQLIDSSEAVDSLTVSLAPFYSTIWPYLDQSSVGFSGSIWASSLSLLSSCARNGAFVDESEMSNSLSQAMQLLSLPALRITLEVIHHNRQQMKPSHFLSLLLGLADHAVEMSEESVEQFLLKKSMLDGAGDNFSSEDWQNLESADLQIGEVCRSLQLAGGCKLLKPVLPHLQGWMELDTEDDAALCWVRPRAALKILLTLAQPSAGQSPDFSSISDILVDLCISLMSLPSLMELGEQHRLAVLTPVLDLLEAGCIPMFKSYFLKKTCSVLGTAPHQEENSHRLPLLLALQWVVKQPSSTHHAGEWSELATTMVSSLQSKNGQEARAAQNLSQDISLFCVSQA